MLGFDGLLRGGEYFVAVRGQQRLVRGHHRFSGFQRRPDQAAGGLQAPDQLDDDVDGGIGHQRGGVIGKKVFCDMVRPGPGEVGNRHSGNLDPGSALPGQIVGSGLQMGHQGSPDGPAAENGDTHHGHGRAGRGHSMHATAWSASRRPVRRRDG